MLPVALSALGAIPKIDFFNLTLLKVMATRTVYDRKLLDEILTRDGATLIGSYEKLNRETIIQFRCKCGNEHQKKLIQTTISNMLCISCTKSNKKEKTKQTNLERHGVEYVGSVKKTPLERFGAKLPTICLKYQIEPTPENQEKVKLALQARVCSYKRRDLDKQKRYITFDEAKILGNYKIDTFYCYHVNDTELKDIMHLSRKTIAELTLEECLTVSNYIKKSHRPVLLYCHYEYDSKLLVNEIPEIKTLHYNDLVDILNINSNECSYCKCKMTLLNTQYAETRLTFDAIVALNGHRKDNIALCCALCNSKKGNIKLEEEEPENEIVTTSKSS